MGQIRNITPEVLRRIAEEISATRGWLQEIGARPHVVLDVVPPGAGGASGAGVRTAFAQLKLLTEQRIEQLAACVSGADRTINMVAYALTYIATEFPATDQANEQQFAALNAEAEAAVPRTPSPTETDPRFASPAAGPR